MSTSTSIEALVVSIPGCEYEYEYKRHRTHSHTHNCSRTHTHTPTQNCVRTHDIVLKLQCHQYEYKCSTSGCENQHE